MAINLREALRGIEERVEIVAFVMRGTPTETITLATQDIAAFPEVQDVGFVSEEQALERARSELVEFRDAYRDLKANPLPASIEVRMKEGYRQSASVEQVAERMRGFAFVEDVRYGRDWVQRLDQLPAGRSPIASHVVPAADKPHFLARAWERVREEVEKGHQAYVVCPRIGDEEDGAKAKRKSPEDEAEKRPPLAVLDTAEQLARGPLAGLRVEVLHGRMQPDDKDAVMRRFAAGEVDVLVATTVIEVGVNVPNATVMVIMDADRFGVSQLHQLRGRVGRGSAPGLCLLVTEMPEASPARQRLDAVASTLDGFELSRIDLEQRREGDVLGQAQSGTRSSLRMLAVIDDEEVIAEAREEATRIVAADPDLERLPALRTALDALLDEEREQYLEKG